MKDILIAKEALADHAIAVVQKGAVITSDARGISPMLDFIGEGKDLCGAAVADRIVGRAAALLFLYAGVREVWAAVISRPALALLLGAGVACRYDVLTEYIVNRKGDGICPMEAATLSVRDPKVAYPILLQARDAMRQAALQKG